MFNFFMWCFIDDTNLLHVIVSVTEMARILVTV